jgi:hypothetical protein
MKVSPKKPQASHLRLEANFIAWERFKHPFILDHGNLRAFLDLYERYEGKFVFDKTTNRLAIVLGEDVSHRVLVQALRKNPAEKEKMMGAVIHFEKKAGVIRFELSGDSSMFGKPSEGELRHVADHLVGLLRDLDLAATIEPSPYSLFISAKQ